MRKNHTLFALCVVALLASAIVFGSGIDAIVADLLIVKELQLISRPIQRDEPPDILPECDGYLAGTLLTRPIRGVSCAPCPDRVQLCFCNGSRWVQISPNIQGECGP